MFEGLSISEQDAVATLWLERPDRGNALDSSLLESLLAAAEHVSERDHIRVVLLRGRGRHFSVGADLKEPPPEPRPTLQTRRRRTELGGRLIRAIQEIRQPTICALHGAANGGGACIAAACDFRLATADARVGYGEVRLGMPLMWQALPLCVHLIGPARAKRMIMSGHGFDAGTLHEWGFVDEVVSSDQLDDRLQAWAAEYAALPPIAVQMIKRSVNAVSAALDGAVMHMDADQFLLATRSRDHREGVAAFLEKRDPDFRGD